MKPHVLYFDEGDSEMATQKGEQDQDRRTNSDRRKDVGRAEGGRRAVDSSMHNLRHGRQGLESRTVDTERVAFFDPEACQDHGCHVTPVFPTEDYSTVFGMSIIAGHPRRRDDD